jgi:hypothetical protein
VRFGLEKTRLFYRKLGIKHLSFRSEMWLGVLGENPICRVSVFAVLQDNAFQGGIATYYLWISLCVICVRNRENACRPRTC